MKNNNLISAKQNAVNFLLGDDVQIVGVKKWSVNQHITIQASNVECLKEHLPSQFGQIICPKNDKGHRSLQLFYLKHRSNENAVVVSVFFEPEFLRQWDEQTLFSEEAFNENNAGLQIPFCPEIDAAISSIIAYSEKTIFAEKLHQMQLSMLLVSKAIEHIGAANDTYTIPACSFLNNNTEREKVLQAHQILTDEFEQMISIKELSKRVAINECYLKKGFKTMFGKTINEYQQHLRISKAKQLLQTDGYTVSDVANALGYSSISHFSTAFKKATNMKPCELFK